MNYITQSEYDLKMRILTLKRKSEEKLKLDIEKLYLEYNTLGLDTFIPTVGNEYSFSNDGLNWIKKAKLISYSYNGGHPIYFTETMEWNIIKEIN